MMQKLGRAVAAWYRQNARELPWRQSVTPYRTLISEIMLQQTRVEAVRPYFERFLSAFPDLEALARADDDRLMKLWEGLGYYSRARNLKKCAIEVCRRYGGILPSDPRELETLPGIGSYTAGAVAAFAYHVPAVAVDGNVLRVLARLSGDEGDILAPATKARITQLAEAMLPPDAPSEFGQGLIEIGALLCLPKGDPRCGACPLREACSAHINGATSRIPYRSPKAKRRIEEKTILVIRSPSRTLICRRPSRGLLSGLWELPSICGHVGREAALAEAERYGLQPLAIAELNAAKHIFTHIEWHMRGYLIKVAELDENQLSGDLLPIAERECRMPLSAELSAGYALPSAFSAYRETAFNA